MSLGYAEKLSYREDVGTVGMPEIFDPPHVLQRKIEELAVLVQKSKNLVAFTGAGISTSSGIPDFRGPRGIWTLQRAGKGIPGSSLPFDRATPSLTHMALIGLEKAGILKFVISQNVDSLHLRSGIPRDKIAELHGNSFMEVCPSCGTEYLRDFEIETVGLKETPRCCINTTCGARLRDTVLDWEDALPTKEMNAAIKYCCEADVVLCLGTSLQITPACNFPLRSIKNGGKMVIVNLQSTPKDKKACLVIHGLVDKVISGVMHALNLQIPPYIRIDYVQLILLCSIKGSAEGASVEWSLRVASVHDQRAPLPFLRSVQIFFPERPDLKEAILDKQPFHLKRETSCRGPLKILLTFHFVDGCGCLSSSVEWHVDFQGEQINLSIDRSQVLQELRDSASEASCAGRNAVVERNVQPNSETSLHAIVTNIVRYNCQEACAAPPQGSSWINKHKRSFRRRPCRQSDDHCSSSVPSKRLKLQ